MHLYQYRNPLTQHVFIHMHFTYIAMTLFRLDIITLHFWRINQYWTEPNQKPDITAVAKIGPHFHVWILVIFVSWSNMDTCAPHIAVTLLFPAVQQAVSTDFSISTWHMSMPFSAISSCHQTIRKLGAPLRQYWTTVGIGTGPKTVSLALIDVRETKPCIVLSQSFNLQSNAECERWILTFPSTPSTVPLVLTFPITMLVSRGSWDWKLKNQIASGTSFKISVVRAPATKYRTCMQ